MAIPWHDCALERSGRDVEQFLKGLDGALGELMRTLDAVISAEMAGLERLLWEGVFWGGTEQQIVGYGSMTQSRPKAPDVDWFLIGLAQQKRHVSVYVNAVKAGKYLLAGVGASLGQVNVGSAAITVPRLDALDQAAFRRLIVEARSLTPDVR